jgi:tetraacyldisaccharide 4'-kinase
MAEFPSFPHLFLNFSRMIVLRMLLLPFSLLYGGVMALRNFAYDRGWKRSYRVSIPVISIGNITVGGTGKTPMAEFLLAKLHTMGFKPAYLSRGYGRVTKGYLPVNPEKGGASEFGDEALQVAHRFPWLPVAVCEDRVAGAKTLIATQEPDILVLDDAFQHRRIRRDLDWVMIDASRLPTSDWPFPAGRLREFRSGLRRADTLILSKFNNPGVRQAAVNKIKLRFQHQPLAGFDLSPQAIRPCFPSETPLLHPDGNLEQLEGHTAIAFAGIGNNNHFAAALKGLGLQVLEFFPFADHYAYQPKDIEKILAHFEALREIKGKLAPAFVVTTEKDHFRLKTMPWMQQFAHQPLFYLEVAMEPLFGWENMEQKIKEIRGRFNEANQ